MNKRLMAIVGILSVAVLVVGGLVACAGPAAEPTKAPAPAATKAPAPATEPTKAPAPAATKAPASEPTKAPAAAAPAAAVQASELPKFEGNAVVNPPGAAKKPYRFGVSVPHFRDPYWVALVYGEIDEAQKLGAKVEAVFEAGSYTDLAKQVKQVEDLVERKVDAILFAPVDYEGTAAVVEQATKAGVPVVNVGNLTKSDKVSIGISNSDLAIGASVADWIAGKTNGKAKVVLLSGPAGAQWSVGRANGFKNRVKEKHPGIEILAEKWTNVDRAESQKAMEDWVQAFPQIDAVFGVAAPLGEGAAIVLNQTGRKAKTLVALSTLNEDTLRMLKEGMVDYVQAEQPVLTGRAGVQLAVKVLNGEAIEVPKFGSLDLPKKILYQLNPAYTKDEAGKIDPKNDWAPKDWMPPR